MSRTAHPLRILLTISVLATSACTRSSPSSESGGEGENAAVEGGVDTGDGEAQEGGEAAPIALTDARLDKYLVFRKEFNQRYAAYMKGAVGLAKSVDSKSTDISKAYTAATGAARLGQQFEKTLEDLRAKHGFTQDEDDRLWSAIGDVVAARPMENPALAEGLKSYREMQAKGGEEKKVADEMLKSFEDQEKEGLAEAKKRYGDACVEVLSKRVKELSEFQMSFIKGLADQQEEASK